MDYRQSNCSATSSNTLFFGGCHQNKQVSDTVATWYNTTSPTPVPLNGQRNGGGNCDCKVEWTTTASGSNWNNCEWLGTPTDLLTVQDFSQGATEDLGQCWNIGFKNVAAKRQWHGTPNLYDRNDPHQLVSGTCTTGLIASGSGVWSFVYSDDVIRQAPYQTKYLTIASRCEYSSTNYNIDTGAIIVTYTSNIESTSSVNGMTGIVTTTGTAFTNYPENSNGNSFDTINTSWNDLLLPFYAFTLIHSPPITDYIDLVGSTYRLHYTGDDDGFGNAYDWIVEELTLGSGNCERVVYQYYYHAGIGYVQELFYNEQISISATTATYTRNDYYMHEEGTNFSDSNTNVINFSDPNNAPDIITETETLLNQWSLTDNAVYPWRHDNYITWMPLVGRREVQNNVAPWLSSNPVMDDLTSPLFETGSTTDIAAYNTRSWQDPNDFCWVWKDGYAGTWADSTTSTNMDGTIVGNPLIAGIEGITNSGDTRSIGWGWFDFYYQDIRYCKTPSDMFDCGASPTWEQYNYRFGGTLADADISYSGNADAEQMANVLPMCATHWVNNLQAHGISRGAMQSCGITDGGIWSIKYAETRPSNPSYNFFRPCGSDRVLIDESTGKNFTDSDSLIMDGQLTGLSGGSLILVHNGANNGIYTGCSQTDNGDSTWTLTLGTKTADLPSDYSRPFDNNCVGFVRFPNAWPIGGREQVTVAAGFSGSLTGSIVSFLNGQTNLRTADKIDLSSRTAITIATQSVSRMSDTQFFLHTPYSSSITASIYAMANGAPDYHWFDNGQKFEYRYGFWNTSNRDAIYSNSSSCMSDCLPFTPCAEQVVCFSPNSESFHNGTTRWFASASYVADPTFGSYGSANVEFQMTDLLFQTPMRILAAGIDDSPSYATLKPEDGTCPVDTYDIDTGAPILFYKIPTVEALCSVPAGSPALPSGIAISPLSKPALAGLSGYSFTIHNEPTTYFWNAMQHCTDECRFNYFGC